MSAEDNLRIIRVGPFGHAVGPFEDRHEVVQWLWDNDVPVESEGVTWKEYSLYHPSEPMLPEVLGITRSTV